MATGRPPKTATPRNLLIPSARGAEQSTAAASVQSERDNTPPLAAAVLAGAECVVCHCPLPRGVPAVVMGAGVRRCADRRGCIDRMWTRCNS